MQRTTSPDLRSIRTFLSRRFAGAEELVPRRVIHGDLTAGNVLVRDDHITGVFDWANSIAGDPLYDVAWLMFWAPWHPGLAGMDLVSRAREHFDDAGFDDRLRCYAVHVGLDAQRYNAFTSRWEELARSGDRTHELATA